MQVVPAQPSTELLVVRAQAGEADAFEALVRAYLRAAYSVALAVVGRPADAEDVAQDAMLLAFERLDSCREPARFAGWLLQIVRNQALNWLDRRRHRDVPARDEAPEQVREGPMPDASAFRNALVRGLKELTAVQREVILLHDLEGWTHPEIALAIGVTEITSRQHLFQARRRLREQLGDQDSNRGES